MVDKQMAAFEQVQYRRPFAINGGILPGNPLLLLAANRPKQRRIHRHIDVIFVKLQGDLLLAAEQGTHHGRRVVQHQDHAQTQETELQPESQ